MKAIVFDDGLKFVDNYPKPVAQKGESIIKVELAGICNTDFEITKGYMGYKGILGHEFVGTVIESEDNNLIGKHVVGEINQGCGNCQWCAQGLERHCPNRTTLGIWRKEGCFAEYVAIANKNLFIIPDSVTIEEAVFIEPIAAAVEILEQLHIKPLDKVAVLGDGKLGLCVAMVLASFNLNVTHIGKHKNKLAISEKCGVKTKLLYELSENQHLNKAFDVVVEATGSIGGFETSLQLTKPRGVLVLKSTIAAKEGLNLAPVVIDEITVLGSRCGRFEPALRLLESKKLDPRPMISKVYPLENALDAFEANKEKDTLKVLIKF